MPGHDPLVDVTAPAAGASSALPGSLPPSAARTRDTTASPVRETDGPARRGRLLDAAVLTGSVLWLTCVFYRHWPAHHLPSFRGGIPIDAAVYALAGDLLRRGGTPYVTYWDHKPPLVHLANTAGLALGGMWGVWLLCLLALLLAVVLLNRALRAITGSAGAMVGTVYFACTVPVVMTPDLTEWYALPLQCASAFVLALAVTGRRSAFRLAAAAGALSALGFFLRPNLLGAGAVVVAAIAVTSLVRGDAPRALRVAVGGACGAALVALAVLGYVAAMGAFEPFAEQVFRYNAKYASVPWSARLSAMVAGIQTTTTHGSLVVPAIGWLVAARRLRARGRDAALFTVTLVAVVWLPLEAVLAALSGRNYAHYFHALLPPLALLAAVAGDEIATLLAAADEPRHADARSTAMLRTPLMAGLVAGMVGHALIGTLPMLRYGVGMDERAEQVAATAAYVRRHTPSTGTVFVWGHAADVYLFSERRPASRFIYPQPLLTPGYADAALVGGFMRELRLAAPTLIVDATGSRLHGEDLTPPLARWDPGWGYPRRIDASPAPARRAFWSMTPALEAFYAWVGTNYAPVDTVGPARWVVYRRRGPLASAAPR